MGDFLPVEQMVGDEHSLGRTSAAFRWNKCYCFCVLVEEVWLKGHSLVPKLIASLLPYDNVLFEIIGNPWWICLFCRLTSLMHFFDTIGISRAVTERPKIRTLGLMMKNED